MKKILSCFVFSFLLLFIASQFLYAQPAPSMDKSEKSFQEEGHFPMMPSMPCPMEQMRVMPGFRHPLWMHIDDLNLDEKQMDALKQMENSVSKEMIRKKADEQIAEIELKELLDQETVDLKAVEIKLKQIATIKTEIRLIVIRSMENMKAKLTPKQLQMLKKLRPMEHHVRTPFKGKVMHNETRMPPPDAGEKGEESGE